jgi:hypothetical protein
MHSAHPCDHLYPKINKVHTVCTSSQWADKVSVYIVYILKSYDPNVHNILTLPMSRLIQHVHIGVCPASRVIQLAHIRSLPTSRLIQYVGEHFLSTRLVDFILRQTMKESNPRRCTSLSKVYFDMMNNKTFNAQKLFDLLCE